MPLRNLYRAIVPEDQRYWLYKLRNPAAFRQLRSAVFPSPKGDFSLRAFDEHRCIFVHITKTAGTSVALSLFGVLPYHYTARQYRVIFGRRDFARYFKFAFVRNPWDRLYSAYSYLKGGGWNDNDRAWYESNLAAVPDFNAFVMDWLNPHRLAAHVHLRPQCHFICDHRGRPLIDHFGYFETLHDDLPHITERLQLTASLRRVNASTRADYRSVYSPEAREKVGRLYAADAERFGYDFEGIRERMEVCGARFAPR